MNISFTHRLSFQEAQVYLEEQFKSFKLESYVESSRSARIELMGAIRRKELCFDEPTESFDFQDLRSWIEYRARGALIKISFAITHEAIKQHNYEELCVSLAKHMKSTGLFSDEEADRYCIPFKKVSS